MKLEVGMYVRTPYGIRKIVNITKDDGYKPRVKVIEFDRMLNTTYKMDYIFYTDEHTIKKSKASHNIIDLIEVGDIITFKFSNDVYKVLCVPNKKVGCEDFYFEYDISQEFEDLRMKPEMVKGQIKSIITKEQFESIKYSLEG